MQDYGILKIFLDNDGIVGTDAMRDIYNRALTPLIEYDKRNEGDLLKTLEIYLQSDLSVVHTASKLFLHKNTLRYRLEKIEKLGMIDFEYEGGHYFIFTEDEKKNMLISGRGTFTPEEMKIMQDHVAITWEMLSKLTFPKKYENVAFYAATHHEALNGKGYPNHYKAENLPLQSRIIAVADIFEALTASDRPYKQAKTLSESLTIMGSMVKDGYLDKDLVDFFLDSGLYKEFAERFMNKDYIDDVDIDSIKSKYSNQ